MLLIEPIKEGFAYTSDDGSCGYAYAVFLVSEARAYLAAYGMTLEDRNAAQDLTGWREFWRGAGSTFGGEPTIRVYGRKVIVRQRRGLDI